MQPKAVTDHSQGPALLTIARCSLLQGEVMLLLLVLLLVQTCCCCQAPPLHACV
jgi:hypothetical protein